MRREIVLLTRIWPTPDRPSLGAFVRDRARGVTGLRVIKPGSKSLPWPLLYARMLWAALRVRRLEGIEAHVVAPTGLIGWLAARLRQVPVLVYAHGGDVRDWERQAWPRRWVTRFVVRHVDRVVTNSDDTAAHIRRLGVEPVIAPPGVELERFGVSPPPRMGKVLYLGGRNPRKGYDVARDLADTLVGPWLEDVEPDEVPALMARHDVVLMPSLEEPFGIVAVEAIASGRWVVASAVGGLRDIVIDGVNGTLVTDGDFAGALARVPEYDPRAVAETARRFSLEAWQRRMEELWSDLLGRRSGP